MSTTAPLPPTAAGLDLPAPLDVLYVEDQPVNVLLMQALLGLRPAVALRVATDCAEADRALAERVPQLLLVDLQLPDGHGADWLRRIRAQGVTGVPAIAVTADAEHGLPEGLFDEVWVKPLDMHATLRRVDRWLAAVPTAVRDPH